MLSLQSVYVQSARSVMSSDIINAKQPLKLLPCWSPSSTFSYNSTTAVVWCCQLKAWTMEFENLDISLGWKVKPGSEQYKILSKSISVTNYIF